MSRVLPDAPTHIASSRERLALAFLRQHCCVGAALYAAVRVPCALAMTHEHDPFPGADRRERQRRGIDPVVELGKLILPSRGAGRRSAAARGKDLWSVGPSTLRIVARSIGPA